MTFIPQKNEKYCFISCSEDKIKLGRCSCVNNKQIKYSFMKTLEIKLKKDVLIVQPDERGNINSCIALHSKKWNFICLGSELTEEIASEFMSDFDAFNEFTFSYEYLKSFIYIIATKGFYWLENPVKIHTLASENADEYRKKWQEAEEKTFKNPLIFVKK